MARGIKNIILDFGGVVIDLDRAAAVSRFEEIGIKNAENMLGQFWHNGAFADLERGAINKYEFYNQLREASGLNISDDDIKSGWLAFVQNVPQRRLDFITKLRDNYNLFLLSNTNEIVMDWAHSSAFSDRGLPIDKYFDKLYLSYKINALKPDNEIYEYVIRDSGIVPEETIFLDDSDVNLKGAEKFGIRTMLTINGTDWMEDLEQYLAQ